MVRFDGVESREAAELLVGMTLSVDRESLPALERDEIYLVDLVGLDAVDSGGQRLGTIVGLETDGKEDFLVVRGGDREELAPIRDGTIASVDRTARRVTLAVEIELGRGTRRE